MARYIVYDKHKGVFLGIVNGDLRWSVASPLPVVPDATPELSSAPTFESWEQMDDYYSGEYGKDDFSACAELKQVTPTVASWQDCEAAGVKWR